MVASRGGKPGQGKFGNELDSGHMKLKKSHGFSILEIMIVVLLIGVMGAFSVRPAKGYLQRIRLQNAAEGLKHYLMTTRSRATSNAFLHAGMVFKVKTAPTPDSACAFIDRSKPINNAFDAGTDSLYKIGLEFKDKEGIQMSIPSGFPSAIVFRGDGSANASAKVVLTLGVFQDTVDVLASTGRVRVRIK